MTAQTIAANIMPNQYGAKEIKEFIRKHTWRAFFIVIIALSLIVLYSFLSGTSEEDLLKQKMMTMNPINKMTLESLAAPEDAQDEVAPPPDMQTIVNTGPAARAGNPVPVPDAEISPEMQDFATVDVMSRASAEGGSGVDLGGFATNIDFDAKEDLKVKKVEEPAPDEFIPVEKQPGIDLVELQKTVVYPEMAKKAGIEGRVILRVLVDTDGSVRKVMVQHSDSKMLNQAAVDAVQKATFTPAIQNNQPVMVWVSIPINFKLR